MRVYIKKDKYGEVGNQNIYSAFSGFKQLGAEIIFFQDIEKVEDNRLEDVVVGSIKDVRYTLNKFCRDIPDICYPKELEHYLGRKICLCEYKDILYRTRDQQLFIKPVEGKLFNGTIIKGQSDFVKCGRIEDNAMIWSSEVVEFVSEYRVFVRYNKILDIRRYYGDYRKFINIDIVEEGVKDYTSAPNGYGIDFGLTSDGRTLLIEVNDGYSLGQYGLNDLDYAKLLKARWCELTGTEDELIIC